MDERLRGETSALLEGEPAAPGGLDDLAVCRGLVTMATLAWFLAAARTIEGPPMSICSTHSSSLAPEATVSLNG